MTIPRLVFVGVLTVAGVLAVLFTTTRTEPEPDPGLALEAAIAQSLDDYRPYDVMQTPDEYDASRAECWNRNQELAAIVMQLQLRADSLEWSYYRARVRIAELEAE
jgi:hypothetical protein